MWWLSHLVMLSCAFSMVATAWLMWKIGKPQSKGVLPLQLWNLACADFANCLGMLLYEVFKEPTLTRKMRWFYSSASIDWCGYFASLLMELYVAAGFTAIFWRSLILMKFVNTTLWLPWLCAVVLTSMFLIGVAQGVRQVWIDEAMVSCTIIITSTTFILFLSAFVKSSWYPARSHRRAATRVWLYAVAFALTICPGIIVLVNGRTMQDRVFARIFGALNGMANVLCYACDSSFSSGYPWKSGLAVNADTSPRNSFEGWGGPCAVPVGFAVEHVEIVVTPCQSFALLESERMTAELELEGDS